MRLEELCRGLALIDVPQEFYDLDILRIQTDSRCITSGDLFVCLTGEKDDGSSFIGQAVDRGARAVLAPRGVEFSQDHHNIALLKCDQPKEQLPILLNRFYHDPSRKLTLIGITGTNGKTTTSYVIESIYHSAGKLCGVIGTVNYRFGGKVFSAKNTTPGLVDNVFYIQQMCDAGLSACVMEVSSHALVQDRVKGLKFDEAVFTNLTSDHLDYHKDQESYFLAKSRFFDGSMIIENAVINIDDDYGMRLVDVVSEKVLTYGIARPADIQAKDIKMTLVGSQFTLVYNGSKLSIVTPMIGKHNIYNILAAAGVCVRQGFSLNDIKKGIELLSGVPGRLERIEDEKGRFIFIDYAHTEDALQNVLRSIKDIAPARILTVFGCGGDRDKTKRPKMAAAVQQFSDLAIVTNDNPRTEDPQAIKNDILKGFSGNCYEVVLDRAQAIKRALDLAKPNDCVFIAGKGHENYQIFKDETISFDDREVVKGFLI